MSLAHASNKPACVIVASPLGGQPKAASWGHLKTAVRQDLVETCSFAAGYQCVRRFVSNLHTSPSREACAVIETAPGEDYGESGVMVRAAALVTKESLAIEVDASLSGMRVTRGRIGS